MHGKECSQKLIGRYKKAVPFAVLFAFAMGAVFMSHAYEAPYPEVREIDGTQMGFSEIASYFEELAKEKGAVYAFEILRRAELPKNLDLHLLGHVVGDQLYAQEGVGGISKCTHDFRNACSHSVVIGALLEYGEGALSDIRDACHLAPGGKGAYRMCFHGFGHGVLAYLDYEFSNVAEFCRAVGTEAYNNREYIECVGGAVMEMVSGIHDPATWEEKKETYFVAGEPFALCDSEHVPEEAREICYTYITPQLFEAAGASLGNPTPEDFKRMFASCEDVNDPELKSVCYGSMGKEFATIARGREIRNVERTTDEELKTMYQWCTLANDEHGTGACMVQVLQSLYWGGENESSASIRFCSLIPHTKHQKDCFSELSHAVRFYKDDRGYYESFCGDIPESLRHECKEVLLEELGA